MPPCSGQSRPSPAGGREDAASLDRPCARRLRELAVGMEECSRRGSNQRMRPKRARKPTISNRWFSGNFRLALTRAEFGEWNRKGAALSEVTAEKEYGVTRDFIVKGIQAGKLEYRDGAVWGNPFLRVLRSQLELYIVAQLGSEYLVSKKSQTELRAISKDC